MRRIILTRVRIYSLFQTAWLLSKQLKIRYWRIFKNVANTCLFGDPLVIDLTQHNYKLRSLMELIFHRLVKLNGRSNVVAFEVIPVLPLPEVYNTVDKPQFYVLDSFILMEDCEYTSYKTGRTKMGTKMVGKIDVFRMPAMIVKHE